MKDERRVSLGSGKGKQVYCQGKFLGDERREHFISWKRVASWASHNSMETWNN